MRKTLKDIKKILPQIKIKKFKSGDKVFDWKIPLEWEIRRIGIPTLAGDV